MSEFTYIEHLDIPVKYRGHILHAEEYNATVDKINEIVDNLQYSYEYHTGLPKYDTIDDTSAFNPQNGVGTIINTPSTGKLYPVTSATYVVTDDINGKFLVDDLSELKTAISDIENNIDNINIPSYIAGNGINIDSNNIVSVKIEDIIDDNTLQINDGKIVVNKDSILEDIPTKIETLEDNIANVEQNLTTEISNVNSYVNDLSDKVDTINIPSYYGGTAITVDDENKINVVINDIVDNTTLKTDENGKITVDTTYILGDVASDIISLDEDVTYIDTKLDETINKLNTYVDELTDKIDNINIEIPSYIAGDGINIDNNVVSLDASYLIEEVEKPSIYLNEEGKLVVNNEVVLVNAETKFKFIDETGNWVGDMANVKNYIDEQDTALNNKIDTSVNEIYTYVSKFTEYEVFGKNYSPSDEFINKNR